MQLNIDGEYGGDAPVRFENLNHHIEVVANVSPIENEIKNLSDEERAKMESIFDSEMISNEQIASETKLPKEIE